MTDYEEEEPAGDNPTPAGAGTDPEDYLIGACLLDEGATLDKAIQAGLTTADLLNPRRALTYGALRQLRAKQIPIGLDTLVTELGPRLQDAGGLQELMALDGPLVGTTLHAGHYIRLILDRSARARVVRQARDLIARVEKGEMVPELEGEKAEIKGIFPQRKPSEFTIPPASDKSILLGNRYLNRGDGLVLSGSSGMGKSSISQQMAANWALGHAFHGIKPNGPLSSLIVQSEDSDGDIAEVWSSLRHAGQWTADEQASIDARVRIVTDRTNRGGAFLRALKHHIESFRPDLVFINPLQAFMDGDVTESKDLGLFLREGLNGINPSAFGYILVHHTTKPATGKDKHERLWHEVMYDMAGGAELINWARGILSLRPTENHGEFNLVLAKRGRRAGITKEVPQGAGFRLEPVTTLPLKHSDQKLPSGIPCIHWESRLEDVKPEPAKNGGRSVKYKFETYRSVMPKKTDPGKPFNQILQATAANGQIPRGSLQATLERWMDDGDMVAIKPETGATLYRAAL